MWCMMLNTIFILNIFTLVKQTSIGMLVIFKTELHCQRDNECLPKVTSMALTWNCVNWHAPQWLDFFLLAYCLLGISDGNIWVYDVLANFVNLLKPCITSRNFGYVKAFLLLNELLQ